MDGDAPRFPHLWSPQLPATHAEVPTSPRLRVNPEDDKFWRNFLAEDFSRRGGGSASLGVRPFLGFRAARRYGLLSSHYGRFTGGDTDC